MDSLRPWSPRFIAARAATYARKTGPKSAAIVFAALSALGGAQAATRITRSDDAEARELFRQLIEINTTDSVGSVTEAARAMAKRLRDAGFMGADVQVLGPNERKKNMVARLRGSGKQKPVLFIGHLDVVEARREDWSTDPFKLVEKDGFFYGRGTLDMKNSDAVMIRSLIRMKKAGIKPNRDIILALTAGEESGIANGVDWLFKNHRELVNAEFVINMDDNSVIADRGKAAYYKMVATEKVDADFELMSVDPGGHSSMPRADNAIYQLANALVRIEKFRFPFELNNVSRAMFEAWAKLAAGPNADDLRAVVEDTPGSAVIDRLSKDETINSVMRTTCVATRLDGGHANNALPQRARANINCRILPGHSPEEVRLTLVKALADPKISVRYVSDDGDVLATAPENRGFAPPPLRPEIMTPLNRLVAQFWPGLVVVPTMDAGASDDVYVNAARLPSYIVTGFQLNLGDDRSHGRDERIGVESFYTGNEFMYRFIRALTSD